MYAADGRRWFRVICDETVAKWVCEYTGQFTPKTMSKIGKSRSKIRTLESIPHATSDKAGKYLAPMFKLNLRYTTYGRMTPGEMREGTRGQMRRVQSVAVAGSQLMSWNWTTCMKHSGTRVAGISATRCSKTTSGRSPTSQRRSLPGRVPYRNTMSQTTNVTKCTSRCTTPTYKKLIEERIISFDGQNETITPDETAELRVPLPTAIHCATVAIQRINAIRSAIGTRPTTVGQRGGIAPASGATPPNRW